MSYLKFDKAQLTNLNYSLQREFIQTNEAGTCVSTTISGCNTRKYHGLLIVPFGNEELSKHVLLSSLDETVLQNGSSFNLGIRKYQGAHYEPRGHKYIHEFEAGLLPRVVYKVGDIVLSKEHLLSEKKHQVLVRYTLLESQLSVRLQLKPFLAFRSIHQLSKANGQLNHSFSGIKNGIKVCLYPGYPELFMQYSKTADFRHYPDWYYNVEYEDEQKRGYEFKEDLFVPGYFELSLKPGESIVFSASTSNNSPAGLKKVFEKEITKAHIPEHPFSYLKRAAGQFVVRKGRQTELFAGFHWYGKISRQTFIALPGLSLSLGKPEICEQVLDTQLQMLNQRFDEVSHDQLACFLHSADTTLWFFWAVQQYFIYTNNSSKIWKKYAPMMLRILDAYSNSCNPDIRLLPNGLIYAKSANKALTWMDSQIEGVPLVQRGGCPVEVNALWYNAVCFLLELAKLENQSVLLERWRGLPERIEQAFVDTFWSDDKQYLADFADSEQTDWSVRPNMLLAAAMKYSPIDREKQKQLVSLMKLDLLTPRGLRTLSPRDPNYQGRCDGDSFSRERAMHQGTVWPWFISFFVESYLKIHGKGGLPFVRKIVDDFEDVLSMNCIGTISEMYTGDPPHEARGAVSQAWSVAAILRSYELIDRFNS